MREDCKNVPPELDNDEFKILIAKKVFHYAVQSVLKFHRENTVCNDLKVDNFLTSFPNKLISSINDLDLILTMIDLETFI